MSMALLQTALLDLAHGLADLGRPLVIGGGLGLYLKQIQLERQGVQRSLVPGEQWPPARATEDMDVFLDTEVVIDSPSMRRIRRVLEELGYVPDVEFLQFVKQSPRGPIKIDLLTGPIPERYHARLKIKPPRVRPIGNVGLHAYLTRDAVAIDKGAVEVQLRGVLSSGASATTTVLVPGPFTYLLMKLHSFRDRLERGDLELARKHLMDLFRTMAMVTPSEYDQREEQIRSALRRRNGQAHCGWSVGSTQEHQCDNEARCWIRSRAETVGRQFQYATARSRAGRFPQISPPPRREGCPALHAQYEAQRRGAADRGKWLP